MAGHQPHFILKQAIWYLVAIIFAALAIRFILTASFEISIIPQKVYAQETNIRPNASQVHKTWTKDEIKTLIIQEAKKYGVNPRVATFIVERESNFDPSRSGDGGMSRGLWQIYAPAHPNITPSQALSPLWSTEWAMKEIVAGRINEWSTFRECKNMYLDCPF